MTLELEFKYGNQPEPPPSVDLPDNLYRVKHDIELGPLWRKWVPEVFVMNPIKKVKMTKAWQELMWGLFLYGAEKSVGNGDYAKKKWTELYGCHRAFDNNNGFECKKNPPHGPFANYILGKDLGEELPAFDKPRLCGGATISVTLKDGKYWVETLTSPPALDWLIERPWLYFEATTVHEDGTIGKFPQGDSSPVYVPIVSAEPVHYPIEYLEKVDHIVNPYQINF